MSSTESSPRTPQDLANSPERIVAAVNAIRRITDATDAAELLEVLFGATRAIGASAALYLAQVPESEEGGLSFTLFASDPRLASDLRLQNGSREHPWIRHALGRSTPSTDHEVPLLSSDDVAAVDLARRCGFSACLLVPTTAGHALHRSELLCIGSDQEDAFEGEPARVLKLLARALAAELHDWFTRQLRDHVARGARLRPSDILLLDLEWQGLGTKGISERTGLSPASVDSRFQRLIARMHCRTRQAAARRAAEFGLFESGRDAPRSSRPGNATTR